MLIETMNPATGQILKQYQLSSDECVQKQIQFSHAAFLKWRFLEVHQRIALVEKILLVLDASKQDCAELICMEMGKPIKFALAEIEKCMLCIRYYCENVEKFLRSEAVITEYQSSFVCYNPMGPILAVMPWNFPFWQVFRFLIPCLLAGNTVLLKHASIVTGCAQKIEQLIREAGLPEYVFKHLLIHSKQVAEVIKHPDVRGVTVTGSEAAGKDIAMLAGQYLKKSVLELGGNDACLVLEDANLERAAKSIVSSRLRNTGQVCVATKRVIVIKSVHQTLLNLILQEIQLYPMMNPQDPSSNLGPMARSDLRDNIHQQILQIVSEGAQLLCGGYLPEGEGFYYPPTLLDQVSSESLAYQEELFGPVICVTVVEDLEQAIQYANATRFGLGANIFTSNLELAKRIAKQRIDSGSCFVNMPVTSDPRFPFGGIKDSGFGRELSREGLLEFVNIKTVIVNE